MRKAEKDGKQKLSFRFVPTRSVIKNSKQIGKNLKKYRFGLISSQNRLKKAEKDRKQKLSFRFVPTRRVIENSKEIGKNFKKYHFFASFKAKIG